MTFDNLWERLVALQGHQFTTSGRGSRPGVSFTYTIHGGEMRVSNKNKSITLATVELAYERAVAMNGAVAGPKALGVFGASYLFPMFQAVHIITTTESKREEQKMPRRKGSKNLTIEEKIAAAEQRIAELKEQLNAAEAELEGLKSLRDEEKVKELVEAIGASGKSIDDVIAMVKGSIEPGAGWL